MTESPAMRLMRSVDRSLATLTGLVPPDRMSVLERLLGLGAYGRWREAQAPEVFQ